MQLEVLPLSSYDPEMDIIICNVYVGKMPPSRVPRYLEKVKERINPIFEKRGFEVLYIAKWHEEQNFKVEVDQKANHEPTDPSTEIDNFLKSIDEIETKEKQKGLNKKFDGAKSALDGACAVVEAQDEYNRTHKLERWE